MNLILLITDKPATAAPRAATDAPRAATDAARVTTDASLTTTTARPDQGNPPPQDTPIPRQPRAHHHLGQQKFSLADSQTSKLLQPEVKTNLG